MKIFSFIIWLSQIIRTGATDMAPIHTTNANAARTQSLLIAALAIITAAIVSWQRADSTARSSPPSVVFFNDVPRLSANRTFIITGANSGLGFSTVEHLARGNTASCIVLACRDMTKCHSAKQDILARTQTTVHLLTLPLDLESLVSIERFVHHLLSQTIIIRMESSPMTLIANAGIMGASAVLTYNRDTHVEQHMHVNHLAHVYLVHLLLASSLPLTRVTMVSSLVAAPRWNVAHGWYVVPPAHVKPPTASTVLRLGMGIRAYGKSKRANLCFASELQRRRIGMVATALHPGVSATGLLEHGIQWVPMWMHQMVTTLIPWVAMTPSWAAWTTLLAALGQPEGGSGVYVGPRWGLWGNPVVAGNVETSWHHWPLPPKEAEWVWKMSMEALDIVEFGKPHHP